jgi:hypothetical protein
MNKLTKILLTGATTIGLGGWVFKQHCDAHMGFIRNIDPVYKFMYKGQVSMVERYDIDDFPYVYKISIGHDRNFRGEVITDDNVKVTCKTFSYKLKSLDMEKYGEHDIAE